MHFQVRKHLLVLVSILCLVCAAVAVAQVKTTKTEIPGQASNQVTVERGEVVYVVGNDLVVKMENGDIRHFTVPDDAKAMVNGKELTLKDLKPGMKLERTITTTTAQKTVKTVKTGTGIVVNIVPPLSITLRFEDNTVQSFKIPKDQVFVVDGQKMDAFKVKKGMRITATRIDEVPMTEVSSSKQLTGAVPPPTPQLEGVLLVATNQPKPAPAALDTKVTEPAAAPAATPAEPPAKKLPKTGSMVPLIGLFGILFSGASFAMRLFRRS
jgi:LPXTG-motif cell wall-anchored protein